MQFFYLTIIPLCGIVAINYLYTINYLYIMKKDEGLLTEVFSGTPWEAEMVKNLLENAEISACIRNSILQSNMYDPIYSSGTKVVVLEADKERALEIVYGYYENLKK